MNYLIEPTAHFGAEQPAERGVERGAFRPSDRQDRSTMWSSDAPASGDLGCASTLILKSNLDLSFGNLSSEKQQYLKRTINWYSLAIIGVSYVISGEFAGWNAGLSVGLNAFLVAYGLISVFYLTFGLCICELSAALPAAGGGYTFARAAMGNVGGFVTGSVVLLEYVCTASAISTFTTVYISQLVGRELPLSAVLLALYAVCSAIHSYGVGEAVMVLLIITGLAIVGLIIFYVGAGLRLSRENISANDGVPFTSVWNAIPYAMWFYLAIEGVPLAAEEALHPEKTVPKGYIASWLSLFVFGLLTTLMTVGAIGAQNASVSNSPLVDSLMSLDGRHTIVSRVVNVIGLFGLLASLFAVIYGYSRLTYALARACFLPECLSKLNRRRSPYIAICVPSSVAFGMSLGALALNSWSASAGGNLLLKTAVMSAAISYAMIMLSYIILSIMQPYLNRPYRVLCFVPVTASLLCIIVTFAVLMTSDWRAAVIVGGALVIALLYYFTMGSYKLVDDTQDLLARERTESTTATSDT